jgi:hypothetical protein
LAFKHLEQKVESVAFPVESRRRETQGMIVELKKTIATTLADARSRCSRSTVDQAVVQHHQKLKRQKIDLDQVVTWWRSDRPDRSATATPRWHHPSTWSPVPGRIKTLRDAAAERAHRCTPR